MTILLNLIHRIEVNILFDIFKKRVSFVSSLCTNTFSSISRTIDMIIKSNTTQITASLILTYSESIISYMTSFIATQNKEFIFLILTVINTCNSIAVKA